MSLSLTLPMDVEVLIPQRKPMRFISRLLWYEDKQAVVEALVEPDNPMLDSDGNLARVALLEIFAQACAASRGYEDSLDGGAIKVGFLVGTRGFRVGLGARVGDLLTVHTKTVGAFEGFSLVEGEIRRGDETLAAGTLKLWVTDDAPGSAVRP